MLTNGEII